MRIGLSLIASGAVLLATALLAAEANFYEAASVANFAAAGDRLSFWSGPNGRRVEFTAGRAAPVQLEYAGGIHGGFALRCPDGAVLDVVPAGQVLQVRDRAGKYRRTFAWRYEGPIDGRGTACTPCVPQSAAVDFVREHFMQTGAYE